jgi:sugar phosphate isomerase/epimerase
MLRRDLLLSLPTLLALRNSTLAATFSGQRLGLAIQSYAHRWKSSHSSLKYPAFRDALDVMDHGREIGVGSLQIDMTDWDRDLAQKVRSSCESYDMNIEGSLRLPQALGDVDRFIREIKIGKEAGATLFHTVLGGARYEVFTRLADYEQWKSTLRRTLELAETAARKQGVKIAVENHQDLQTSEWIELMDSLSSSQIGICLDTGSNLGLLESPLEVVRRLAPYTLSVNLKDVAVHAVEDGFEMAAAPLGQGILDLPEMLRILRADAPRVEYHLKMPTCDAQHVPCMSDAYWSTFPEKSGIDLARTLTLIQNKGLPKLPQISSISPEGKLVLEEKNILDSFSYAGSSLGFYQIQIMKAQAEDH